MRRSQPFSVVLRRLTQARCCVKGRSEFLTAKKVARQIQLFLLAPRFPPLPPSRPLRRRAPRRNTVSFRGCALWLGIFLGAIRLEVTASAPLPVGNFFHVFNNVALESNRTISNAWRTTSSATLATAAGVALTGSTSCLNTGRTSEMRLSLSSNGTTVSWACYVSAANIDPLASTTIRRGINSVLQTGIVSTTTLAASAYVRGVVNAAVADDSGGFYVSVPFSRLSSRAS